MKVFEETTKSVSDAIEIAYRLGKVGAVDIRDKPECHGAVGVVPERFIGHHRPEVGAADADIDDIADALAGMPLPRAAADAVGEVGHPVEDGVNPGHDILAIHHDRSASRGAQGHMQHRPLFRDVDLLATEHRIDARAQADRLRQIDEEAEGLAGDAVFRIIEVDPRCLGGHLFAAPRIIREQLSQMQIADLVIMGLESLPDRALNQWLGVCRHGVSPCTPQGAVRVRPRFVVSVTSCSH